MTSERLREVKELLETLKCTVEIRHNEEGMTALLVSDPSTGHDYHILEDEFILSIDSLIQDTYYIDTADRKIDFLSFINERNLDEALIKITTFQPDERTGKLTFSASYVGDFDKQRFIQFYMTYQKNIEEFLINWAPEIKGFKTPADAASLFA